MAAVVAAVVDLAAVVAAVVVTAVVVAASATAGNTFCAMSREGAVTARWQPLRHFCDRGLVILKTRVIRQFGLSAGLLFQGGS